jgi:hypothetical protein
LMGFSTGGTATLEGTKIEGNEQLMDHKFKAAVAYYPLCAASQGDATVPARPSSSMSTRALTTILMLRSLRWEGGCLVTSKNTIQTPQENPSAAFEHSFKRTCQTRARSLSAVASSRASMLGIHARYRREHYRKNIALRRCCKAGGSLAIRTWPSA